MLAHPVDRRSLLSATACAAIVAVFAPAAAAEIVLTPERFGAKGDGRTDDSDAFAMLSDAVNAAGGGTILLRRTTYLVGTQPRGPDGFFLERRLMAFANCHRPIVIRGNGATLRCAAGQRYGMFLPDGTPYPGLAPKRSPGTTRPYGAMIEVALCSGGVTIQDVELDGNSAKLIIGGKRGDKGIQLGCAGVALRNNIGPEQLINVYAHHQPQDGFYVDGPRDPTPGVTRHFMNLRSDANGRQGMSIVGGQDYRIERSSFTRTSRGTVISPPSAGVDIEAQRKKQVRNLSFIGCTFADNRGCAVVADSGDSADVTFTDCKFIGTDNWAAWPNKPNYRFDRCTFVGSIVRPYSDPDPTRATRFTACLFTDDPKLSPTGHIVLRKSKASVFRHADNVLLDRCRFVMVRDGQLPASDGVIYRDCTMSQRSPQKVLVQGTFQGRNQITGPVDLGRSTVIGPTILNGTTLPRQNGLKASAAAATASGGLALIC